MYHFYWDASALVKRYTPEVGTHFVNRLFAHAALDKMMCLSICASEVLSVFVRKKNAGAITEAAFSQAMVNFRADVIDSGDFRLLVPRQLEFDGTHPPHPGLLPPGEKGHVGFEQTASVESDLPPLPRRERR